MANLKSVIKRARQNVKLRQRNMSGRSLYRTYVKYVLKAVEANDVKGANEAYKKAQPMIDKAAQKGIIHKNKAARLKSRLVARVKAISI
ncbi:MAG: 30S ribosomal protein S20 [Legionellales bacterium RIFCSPHIGHO2_12_FULL_37_14]|nr:MAG: 30S ribosomal protein S20 [Legionellales bacterium RIFCSPHIGHO2_12_FULL_37_14]